MSDVTNAIEKAIGRIQEVGWRRGAQVRKGPACLMQSFANGGDKYWGQARYLFEEVMSDGMFISVTGWNDELAEDKWEVISVLLAMHNLAIRRGL